MILRLLAIILFIFSIKVSAQCPASVPPTFTATSSESTCASNGNITVTATGGQTPYLYEITGPVNRPTQTSNEFNAIPSGTYTVTLTDNCGTTFSENIIVAGNYVNPSLTVTSTSPNCYNDSSGTLTFNTAGGVTPYTFELASGSTISDTQTTNIFNNLPQGFYLARVTDACSNISSVFHSITANNSNAFGSVGVVTEVINCDSVKAAVVPVTSPQGNTIAGPVTYSIINGPATYPSQSDSIFHLLKGEEYTVRVEDGCGVVRQETFNSDLKILTNTSENCSGVSLSVVYIQNGIPPYTYQLVNGTDTIGPQSSGTFPNLQAGSYELQVSDNCGDTVFSTQEIINNDFEINSAFGSLVCKPGKVIIKGSVSDAENPLNVKYLTSPGNYNDTTVNFNFFNVFELGLKDSGMYEIEITDGCGQLDTIVFHAGWDFFATPTYVSQINCNSSFNLSNLRVNSSLTSSKYHILTNSLGDTLANQSGSISISNLPQGTYYFEGGINECIASGNDSIGIVYDTIVSTPYTVPSLTTLSTMCNSSNGLGTIIANASDGKAPYNYEIISGPNGATPPSTNNTFTNLPEGTYQIRLIDQCGNSFISGEELSSYGSQNLSFDPINCISTELYLYSDTLPFANYEWTGPNGITSNDRNPIINPFTLNDTGIYELHITYNNCIDTVVDLNVNIPQTVDPSFSSTNFCTTGTNNIVINGTPGGTFSYATPIMDGSNIDSLTGIVSNNHPDSTYLIQYAVEENFCLYYDTVLIQPYELSTSYIIDSITCNSFTNGQITLTATGLYGVNNYQWSTNATTNTITNLGANTYFYTVSDQYNCQKTDSIIVTEPTSINLTAINVTNITCNGYNDGSISISPNGGTPNYTINWSTNETDTIISSLTPGNYQITITDNNNCVLNQSFNINEPDLISNTFTNTNSSCINTNDGTSLSNPTGGNGNFNFAWSNGDTTNQATNLPPNMLYYITITDTLGCFKYDSTTINPTTVLNPSFTTNGYVCLNDSVSITVNAPLATNYLWSTNEIAQNIIVNPTTDTTYYVQVNDGICFENDSVTITIADNPTIIFIHDSIICNNTSLNLTANASASTYEWSTGSTDNTISVLPNNSISYTVTATNNLGCSSSLTFDPSTVQYFTDPTADFSSQNTASSIAEFVFTDESEGEINNWEWDFNDNQTSTSQNPLHEFSASGSYNVSLIVTSTNNCPDTVYKTIEISTEFIIPDVFTPNGDGQNDFFQIPFFNHDKFTLQVYNRWGQILFKSQSHRMIWDGTTEGGAPAPDGTYYIIIEANNPERSISYNGSVTLLR